MNEAEQFNRQVAEARLLFIDYGRPARIHRRAISETIKAFSPDEFGPACWESSKGRVCHAERRATAKRVAARANRSHSAGAFRHLHEPHRRQRQRMSEKGERPGR